MENYALNIDELRTVVKRLSPEIVASPAFANFEMLEKLGITVLTGIAFEDAIIKHVRRGGTARAYKPGVEIEGNKMGMLVERELTTKLSKGLYPDNIQAYREKEPFNISADLNATMPNTLAQINSVQTTYSEDLLSNLFLGQWDPTKKDSWHMMDGICTILQRYINAGEISQTRGNLQPLTDDIDENTDPEDAYQIVKNWVGKWNTKLKAARKRAGGVLLYLSTDVFELVQEGYLKTYTARQIDPVDDDDYQFVGLHGVYFRPTPLMGKGARMIATIPGNFDFGINTKESASSVKVTEDPKDPNYVYFHVQAAAGTRVRFIEPDCLCVNDKSSVPDDSLLGDYQKAGVVVTSNDTTLGTVTATGSDNLLDVADGTSITLTATPTATGKFVKWSDEVDVNPRTVITKGLPLTFQAVFAAKSGN